MRSGVIAQKVGMTRVFTETGEHIPVTVLKLGNCQVLGHRTTEKNGYVALQLGSGTRKTVKNKKMPGHMGVDRITTLNLRVVQTDVERGLILVEGAVPGSKGGWIAVRDAVKKALPKDAPKPGKFRLAEGGEQAASAPAEQEGA